MSTVKRSHIAAIIKSTKETGKVFGVTFIKKNGEVRDMSCRLGVTAHLKGGQMPYDPASKGLLPVYDMHNKGYRMVNLNSIVSVRLDGVEYKAVP